MIGTYHKTLARDDKTGYTYFLFCPKENNIKTKDGLISCYGKIPFIREHTPLYLKGKEGHQFFNVTDYYLYGDTDSLIHYFLGEIKENEKKAIFRLVQNDLFGFCQNENARQVLESQLVHFSDGSSHSKILVQGISSMISNKELFSLFEKLDIPYTSFVIATKCAITVDQLKKNPFLPELGISVYDSEKIMAHFYQSFSPYDLRRVKGYIIDVLCLARDQGHTCCAFSTLCKLTNERIKYSMFPDVFLSASILFLAIKQMPEKCLIKIIHDTAYVYLTKIWKQEEEIIRHSMRIENSKKELISSVSLDEIEKENGFLFNEGQRKAFALLRTSGIKCVVGPPGSGKTALLNGLEMAYKKQFPHETIVSLATTGAASQVIKKSTGRNAETVHKHLGYRPLGQKTFSCKDENNPINASFIIIDEVSMMDLEICSVLLPAVKSGALLLLVGDADQLQSVSYGNVLADFIHSGQFEVYHLTEVMRQTGSIYHNAVRVKIGNDNLILSSHFKLYRFGDEKEALSAMLSNLNVQTSMVLSPVKKGILGTNHLNKIIQQNITRHRPIVFRYGDKVFHEGDRIIMTKTDYQKGYFNGDVGEVVSSHQGLLSVKFLEKTILLDQDDHAQLDLAYSITIHKSQGSEKEDIHILLPESPQNMLNRRLLYTAITRAKNNVYIYYINDALKQAVSNVSEKKRVTNTAVLLMDGLSENKRGE